MHINTRAILENLSELKYELIVTIQILIDIPTDIHLLTAYYI